MGVEYINSGSGAQTGTTAVSVAVTIPACIDGDLLLLSWRGRSGGTVALTPGGTAEKNWILLEGGTGNARALWYKIAFAAADSGQGFNVDQGIAQGRCAAIVSVYRNVDRGNPIIDWRIAGDASVTNHTNSALSIDGANGKLATGGQISTGGLTTGYRIATFWGFASTNGSGNPTLGGTEVFRVTQQSTVSGRANLLASDTGIDEPNMYPAAAATSTTTGAESMGIYTIAIRPARNKRSRRVGGRL